MSYCPRCGFDTDADDAFCRKCGAALAESGAPPIGSGVSMTGAPPVVLPAVRPVAGPSAATPKRRRARVIVAMVAVQLGVGGAIFATVGGDGCSSVTGSFVASGPPLGAFTFTPKMCRSGQRMSFFGVALLGAGPTDGGVLVIDDAVQGKLLKIEVPGSCQPPGYEVCTVVEVRPAQCTTFDVAIERTGTEVNDIRLIDGHATLDCALPEGGKLTAGVVFESCD